MFLSRVIPQHTHTERYEWVQMEFMRFGEFKRYRVQRGMDYYHDCHWCGEPFDEADMLALACAAKAGNKLLCQTCAQQLRDSELAAPNVAIVHVAPQDMQVNDALARLGAFVLDPTNPNTELRAAARAVMHDRLSMIRQLEAMRVAAATRAMQAAASTWICPNCRSENRDDIHRLSCPQCATLRPKKPMEETMSTESSEATTAAAAAHQWATYHRVGKLEARNYVDGEDLTGVSVSPADQARQSLAGGMIARNPDNHTDQWYIAPEFFQKNYREETAVSGSSG